MNNESELIAITPIGEANFQKEVLETSEPVLVEFWSPWSEPCKVFNSVMDEVAMTCAGAVKIVKVNADENPVLSLLFEVQFIPTLLCFVNGKPCATLVGTLSKEAILTALRGVLPAGVVAGRFPDPHSTTRNPSF
jgi:thioredoxin 1